MITAIVCAVVVALLLVSWVDLGVYLVRKFRNRHPVVGGCMQCEVPLTMKSIHVIASVEEDYSGAGSAVSAEFCVKHCPGGCQYEVPITVQKVMSVDE